MKCLTCEEPTNGAFCGPCGRDFASALDSRFAFLGSDLSIGRYEGAYSRWIRLLKSQPFGQLTTLLECQLYDLIDHWAPELEASAPEAFVAVPGYPLRTILETNLALETARRLSQRLGKPCLETLIARSWWGAPQKGRRRRDRLSSIAHEYRLRSNRLSPGLRVCLVDDVRATGATLERCRALLEQAGCPVVATFVLARVP